MIMMGKSFRQIWVNILSVEMQDNTIEGSDTSLQTFIHMDHINSRNKTSISLMLQNDQSRRCTDLMMTVIHS